MPAYHRLAIPLFSLGVLLAGFSAHFQPSPVPHNQEKPENIHRAPSRDRPLTDLL